MERPEEYPWTSYSFFLEGKKNSIVDVRETLLHFSKNFKSTRRNYRVFVEGDISSENPFKNLTRGILEDEQFVESVRVYVNSSGVDEEIPRGQRPTREVAVSAVVERVARFYGKDRKVIIQRGKEKPEREAAVYLAKAHRRGTGD